MSELIGINGKGKKVVKLGTNGKGKRVIIGKDYK